MAQNGASKDISREAQALRASLAKALPDGAVLVTRGSAQDKGLGGLFKDQAFIKDATPAASDPTFDKANNAGVGYSRTMMEALAGLPRDVDAAPVTDASAVRTSERSPIEPADIVFVDVDDDDAPTIDLVDGVDMPEEETDTPVTPDISAKSASQTTSHEGATAKVVADAMRNKQVTVEGQVAVSATSEHARTEEEKQLHLGIGAAEDGKQTSFIMSGAATTMLQESLDDGPASEKKKDEDAMDFALAQYQRALEDILAEIDAALAEIDKKLDQNKHEQDAAANALSALDEIDRLAEEGKLDPGNPQHAALLQQAGLTAKQAKDKEERDRRREELERERLRLQREREELLRQQEEWKQKKEHAESLDPTDPEDQAEIKQLSKTMEGQDILRRGIAKTDDAEKQRVMAEAVVQADKIEVREQTTEAYTQVASNFEGSLNTSTGGFDFDAPPAPISAASSIEPTPIEAASLKPAFQAAHDNAQPATPEPAALNVAHLQATEKPEPPKVG